MSTEYLNYTEWKQWDAASFGCYDSVAAVYFKEEVTAAGVARLEGKRVLELGFGNGSFAAWVRDGGGDYCGIEVNSVLIERARAAGYNVADAAEFRSAEFAGARFDLIVAFDVLEHLPSAELVDLLLTVRSVLADGGRLLARVPNGDSPFHGRIFYGDLTHRSLLGSGAIGQLAAQTGFVVQRIAPPRLPLAGVGIVRALRRGSLLLCRRIVESFLRVLYYDGARVVTTANMVFVLCRAPETAVGRSVPT